MARAMGINHVALEVGDIGEALAWYGRFLDFELRAARLTMVLAVRLHHVHVHVHVHGPKVGYAGLGVAAIASWIGLPGPGEAALVTAGTLAGRGHLDLWAVLAVAWLGAMAGGVG